MTSLHLASHEPEASIKLHDLGINTLLRELLDIHPMRRNDAAFDDISEGDTDDLIKNYSLYLFRTIRSVFALERNRKVTGYNVNNTKYEFSSSFIYQFNLLSSIIGNKASISSQALCFICGCWKLCERA